MAYFFEKQNRTKYPIFDHKPWTNPFGKMPNFAFFLDGCFSNLKRLVYYLEVHKTLRLVFFFAEKQKRTKFLIFDQQPWKKNLP